MAVAMYMNFPNTTRDQYDRVMKELNLKEKPASGLIHHVAGPLESGWVVVDVWESQAAFDKFFKERLQRAMENVNIAPPQPKTFTVHNMIGQTQMAKR